MVPCSEKSGLCNLEKANQFCQQKYPDMISGIIILTQIRIKHGSIPPTLADIIYRSFQAKFSHLVRKFSHMNALFTCVI